MKIFVATSYSSQINYETGQVFAEFRDFLESQFAALEKFGEVFSAIRDDNYQINRSAPAEAFRFDLGKIKDCDIFVAFLNERVSAGVQTEIGIALAFDKKILLAAAPEIDLGYFNQAILRAGAATRISLPLNDDELKETFG